MLTLWDLLAKPKKPARARPARPAPAPPPAPRRESPMQAKYEAMTRDLLREYGVRVRKWRSSMSGVAWEVHYENGHVSRLIEAPRPKGPMSAAVFLHEIGHHAIGFGRYRPRCLEEYHAWRWALQEMDRRGLNVTDNVRLRMHESLHYALDKARRRGIRTIPTELLAYTDPPPRRPRRTGQGANS